MGRRAVLSNEPDTDRDSQAITRVGTEYDAACALRAYVGELPSIVATVRHASLASDLLGAALSEVNWRELVATWREDRFQPVVAPATIP